MDAISYSAARAKFAEIMNRICAEHVPMLITRRRAQAVVMMSLADYQAMEETARLLRNPENVRRLAESLEAAEAKGLQQDSAN